MHFAFFVKTLPFAILATVVSGAILPRQGTPANYTTIFTDQGAAVQAVDFITFNLVETTDACLAFCDSVPTCNFANSYHDNNGKGGSPLLTCSLYVGCHGLNELNNTGGQTQPDGTINFITDSAGFCKATTTPTEPTPTETSTDPAPTETPADPTPTAPPTTTSVPPAPAPTDPTEPASASEV